MNSIRHGRENVIGKLKLFFKYHQLVEKCNILQCSVICVVQLNDLN